MRSTIARAMAALSRPLGRPGRLILILIVLTGPAWLFFAPTDLITREPLKTYRLHRDDFEYLGRSRTFPRTMDNLFVPHNTHVVPAWRIVTWGMVVCAGRISRFPAVLGIASYGILAATMILVGRLVTRETRRPSLGLAATILTGTTSVMLSAGSWYSAGQTLWAGFALLAMLHWLQRWRRRGDWPSLLLASLAAMTSGWLWTVGHIAGLVGAVYLLADPRRGARRRAAIVPLAASVLAVIVTAALARGEVRIETGDGGSKPNGKGSEAISLTSGVSHTLQAIPETLVLGNLGLIAETVPSQGALFSLGIVALWLWTRRRGDGQGTSPSPALIGFRPNPLECAGAVTVVSAYLIEWTFRGYLPFSSLRWQVPWYDTLPQIGAVLFASGWCSGLFEGTSASPSAKARGVARSHAIGLAALVVAMVIVNRPRVEAKWHYLAPAMLPSERAKYPADWLRMQRDHYLFQDQAAWQLRHLFKLERAEAIAQRQGIGRDAVHAAFGRLGAPLIPGVYDALGLLDLPERGSPLDPATRRALAPLFTVEPEERPNWIAPNEPWPPPLNEG